jgi:hypothetical protein
MSQQNFVGIAIRAVLALIAIGAVGYAVWWRIEHERSEEAASKHRAKVDGTPVPGATINPNATSKDMMKTMQPAGKQGPAGKGAPGPMAKGDDVAKKPGGDAAKKWGGDGGAMAKGGGIAKKGVNRDAPSPPEYRVLMGPKPEEDAAPPADAGKSAAAPTGGASKDPAKEAPKSPSADPPKAPADPAKSAAS